MTGREKPNDGENRSRLQMAVQQGNAEEVRRLLNAGTAESGGDGEPTLLKIAAHAGHLEVCKLLLEAGYGCERHGGTVFRPRKQ